MKEQIRQYIPAALYVSALVALLSSWHWKTTGHLSGTTAATFAGFSATSLVCGGFVYGTASRAD